jgi:hypothetical protein
MRCWVWCAVAVAVVIVLLAGQPTCPVSKPTFMDPRSPVRAKPDEARRTSQRSVSPLAAERLLLSLPPSPQSPLAAPLGPPRQVRERAAYAQVGLLESGEKDAVALYGRATRRGGDRWNYYAVSNTLTPQRLPVFFGGRDCAKHTGCAEIGDGDDVDVRGYGASKATVYTRE